MKRTECQRIIDEGILPEDFFKEEIRCDFKVTTKLKKIWAVSLDTLIVFDSICKKHNLKYFLAYGSLLGAIRHKGFIPWDDDFDVFMLRRDYDKLLTLTDEFKEPYFLQTPDTDPGYFYTYAKIRNSRTSCITSQFQYQNINWGQNFDIFPLDNFLIEDGDTIHKQVAKLGTDLSNFMRSSNPNPKSEYERQRICAYSGREPKLTYEDIQSIATKYKDINTGYLSVMTTYLYGFQRGIFHASDFEQAIPCDFEGLKSYIPNGYDRILRTVYGDYMNFPPLENRGLHHDNIYYDPDRPYTEVLKDLRAKD